MRSLSDWIRDHEHRIRRIERAAPALIVIESDDGSKVILIGEQEDGTFGRRVVVNGVVVEETLF